MVQRLTTKALLALVFCMLLILPVSTASAQEGIKKGAETAIDKTEDVGEAVGKGAKDLFTDDDPDSDNDEATAEGMKAIEPQQRSKPGTTYSDPDSSTSMTSQDSETEAASRELPATAGEQPMFVLIGALALVSAAGLKLVRRLPNSQ